MFLRVLMNAAKAIPGDVQRVWVRVPGREPEWP